MTLEAVAWTAVAAARIRAAETRGADPLFTDPLAAAVADTAPPLPPTPTEATAADRALRHYLRLQVTVRTRFYDDVVIGAVADGCVQIVILGAGYDARAFRLPLSGIQVFELDQPAVLGHKAELLAALDLRPGATRVVVPIDLRDDWRAALARAGHDAAQPTMWLAEGLLAYLEPESVEQLLDRLTDGSAPGSRLATEDRRPGSGDGGRWQQSSVAPARLWSTATGPPLPQLLEARGWRSERRSLAAVAREIGRVIPPALAGAAERGGFLTAQLPA